MGIPTAFDRRLFMKQVSALPLLSYFAAHAMLERAAAAMGRNPKDNIYRASSSNGRPSRKNQ